MSDQPRRILLIDDDDDMQHAIRAMLEPDGFEIGCAATGPGGLAALRASPPDLILLDIMLSTPSEGFHLAYEIKNDEQLKRIPIVMISAIGERMGLDFAKEVGSDYAPVEAFLEKPLDAAKLRETVRRVMGAVGE